MAFPFFRSAGRVPSRGAGLRMGILTSVAMWFLAPSASWAQALLDLSVGDIHVSQAVQNDSNSVRFVQQRSTVVRAEVDITGVTFPLFAVDGVLRVYVNGTEITPAAGIPSVNGPIAPPSPFGFEAEGATLNFEIPAPTGIPPSTDVDFFVHLDTIPGEVVTANNTASVENLVFARSCNPTIYYTGVDWVPGGLGLPDPAKIQPGVGDAFVRGIFPFRDGDPDLYTELLAPGIPFSTDDDGDGVIDFSPDGIELLNLLEAWRQLIVLFGYGADDRTFLYGWVRDNPTTVNGLATRPGFAAWGNTQDSRSQRTFAHELGHLLGLPHNTRTVDELGWDVTGRLIDNPTSNGVATRVKGLALNDIMVPAQLTDSAWVDTASYDFFLDHPTLECPVPELIPRIALVQGIFDSAGWELLDLNPVFRYPWPSAPTPEERQQGPFLLRLVDEFGQEYLQNFDATMFTEAEEGPETAFGAFQVRVPVDPNARIALMEIYRGEQLLMTRRGSAPPEIEILSPSAGESLGESTVIEVAIEDPDTAPTDLSMNVAYSHDGGETWVPLQVFVPGDENRFEVDTTRIRRAVGQGMIRVFVSDGTNTSWAEIDLLSTSAAIHPAPEPGFGLGVAGGIAALTAAGRRARARERA